MPQITKGCNDLDDNLFEVMEKLEKFLNVRIADDHKQWLESALLNYYFL